MFVLERGYAAVCPSRPLRSDKGATGAGCGGKVERTGLQDHRFCSCTNFKLNRSVALTEWRQLLSAKVQAAPAIRCEFLFV